VGNIVRAAEHLLTLINDLLDLRRLEEHAASLDLEQVALSPSIGEALELCTPLLEDRRHHTRVEVAHGLPLVRADHRALVQILVNLLSNAAKFTPPGGEIAVRADLDDDGDNVLVDVEDNGIGIDPVDQPRLFNYFEQLGGKHAHQMKGSGIGLALTRALIEKMGGRISVESAPGKGTRFRFTLLRKMEAV
jgi:signal transduction histidine kinase